MTTYTITEEQLATARAARLQLLDRGDEKAAATLDWVLTKKPVENLLVFWMEQASQAHRIHAELRGAQGVIERMQNGTVEPDMILEALALKGINVDTSAGDAVQHCRITAARDVLAERQRQISVEGWTPEHDDEHSVGGMANAAACYALHTEPVGNVGDYLRFWPWAASWRKPKDRRRNLVKAGALILAEIERLDRAAAAKEKQG